MEKALGTIVLIIGLVLIVAGFILGQSGTYVPGNVLGLFSSFTAFCVFGGAVTTFVGFALMAVGPHYRNAGKSK